METPSIQRIRELFKQKGYEFFEKGDYNLNIIGIRNKSNEAGKWDDLFMIIYKEQDMWVVKTYQGTTDPGQTELMKPSFPEAQQNGTAIMVEGQYKGLWKLGKHRGIDALVQKGNLNLYRDNNRNGILDRIKSTIKSWGWGAGINFHPYWGIRKQYDKVYNWSAGCQVPYLHSDSNEWKQLILLFKTASTKYGNSFTYTLINETDLA